MQLLFLPVAKFATLLFLDQERHALPPPGRHELLQALGQFCGRIEFVVFGQFSRGQFAEMPPVLVVPPVGPCGSTRIAAP